MGGDQYFWLVFWCDVVVGWLVSGRVIVLLGCGVDCEGAFMIAKRWIVKFVRFR